MQIYNYIKNVKCTFLETEKDLKATRGSEIITNIELENPILKIKTINDNTLSKEAIQSIKIQVDKIKKIVCDDACVFYTKNNFFNSLGKFNRHFIKFIVF